MSVRFSYPTGVDVRVNGNLAATSISYPVGGITNAAISSSAAIAATKLVHQHALRYAQNGGTDVVAATVPIHIARDAAEIVAVTVSPLVAPAGGDKAVSVDVQLGNAATAFASILSAPISIDSADANRAVVSGDLATFAAVAEDILQVVIAVSGTTGTQAQGLIVTVWIRESP